MEVFEQLAIIGAVLGALALALWALQRRGLVRLNGLRARSRADRELHLVERLQLTPQHAVCLVRLHGRTLLIGTAPNTCILLTEEDQHDLNPSTVNATGVNSI